MKFFRKLQIRNQSREPVVVHSFKKNRTAEKPFPHFRNKQDDIIAQKDVSVQIDHGRPFGIKPLSKFVCIIGHAEDTASQAKVIIFIKLQDVLFLRRYREIAYRNIVGP